MQFSVNKVGFYFLLQVDLHRFECCVQFLYNSTKFRSAIQDAQNFWRQHHLIITLLGESIMSQASLTDLIIYFLDFIFVIETSDLVNGM